MTDHHKTGITTKDYFVHIENNLYECTYFSEELDLNIAKSMVEYRHKVLPHQKIIVFADVRNIKSISKEARDYMSKGKAVENVIATALVANTISSKLMFNFFIHFNKPPVPIKLFQNKEDAIKWLKTKI